MPFRIYESDHSLKKRIGISDELQTTSGTVNISDSSAPSSGDVLIASSATGAAWGASSGNYAIALYNDASAGITYTAAGNSNIITIPGNTVPSAPSNGSSLRLLFHISVENTTTSDSFTVTVGGEALVFTETWNGPGLVIIETEIHKISGGVWVITGSAISDNIVSVSSASGTAFDPTQIIRLGTTSGQAGTLALTQLLYYPI
jgi:hypothetical protein